MIKRNINIINDVFESKHGRINDYFCVVYAISDAHEVQQAMPKKNVKKHKTKR